MNKEELTSYLSNLVKVDAVIGLNMYMIISSDNGIGIKKADIDQDIIQELKDKFREKIKSKFIEDTDYDFVDITNANNKRNAIYNYNIPKKPSGLEVLGEIIGNETQELFNFKKDKFSDITGLVFLLGDVENKMAIYKKMYPIRLMKRYSTLMIFKSNNRIAKVDEDILKINADFDFIQINNDLIVTNTNTLEKYFGFENIIRGHAAVNIGLIKNSGLLEDIDQIIDMAKDLKFARKIMRLRPDSPVLKLAFDKIKYFIENHPKLCNKLKFNLANTKISLQTKVSKELFLKLLDDDFLKSELTELLYESEIKDSITTEIEIDG